MILLKNLINEGTPGMELVKSKFNRPKPSEKGVNPIGKDKYSIQASMGLKMLGVNVHKIRYKVLSGGKSDSGLGNVALRALLKKATPGSNRGKRGNSMWEWGDNVLWEILETAKNNYKSLVKKYHPDRAGGDTEKMALINRAWDVVVKMFKRKGFEFSE